jgi:hypothetical protein
VVVAVVPSGGLGRAPRAGVSGAQRVLRVGLDVRTTYGPLAGIVALAFWAFFSSLALLFGAALAAQLEAVRAGAAAPRASAR